MLRCLCRWRTTCGCSWTAWLKTPRLTLRPKRTWHCSRRVSGPLVLSATSSSNRCWFKNNRLCIVFPWSVIIQLIPSFSALHRPHPVGLWKVSWTGWSSRLSPSSTRNVQLLNTQRSRGCRNWTMPTMQVIYMKCFLFFLYLASWEKRTWSSCGNHVLWQVGRTPLVAHWSLLREIQPRRLLCLGWEWSAGTVMASFLSEEKCSTSGRPRSSRYTAATFQPIYH